MAAATEAALLAAVKNYLDITWTDAGTDTKLTGIIARGKAYLDHIAGAEQDYTVEGLARALLFDYCRFARENAIDEYVEAFIPELMMLRDINVAGGSDGETEEHSP